MGRHRRRRPAYVSEVSSLVHDLRRTGSRVAGSAILRDSPLPAVFPPRQHDDQRIEHGQHYQANAGLQDNPIQLVADEDQLNDDHARIRPELVQQQRDDEPDLDGAMHQQIYGAKDHRTPRESVRRMQKVASDKIVRIFRQLTSSQHRYHMMNAVGRHEEQEQTTDQLGKTVEAFANDADHKKAVEPVLGSEHDYVVPRRANPALFIARYLPGVLRAAYTCSA